MGRRDRFQALGSVKQMGLALGLAALGMIFAILPAQADVFTVTGVKTEATADSAAIARDLAHKRGRRAAFKRLAKRLIRPADWLNIPELSDAELLRMDRGLKIRDERNSLRRYIATVDVSFEPDQVREVLRRTGIPFSDSQARKAVVLPVLQVGSDRVLWDSTNPWLDAWSRRRLLHELAPIQAPLGDLRDISSIDAPRAALAHWPDLSPFAARYGAVDVLVAHGVLEPLGSDAAPAADTAPDAASSFYKLNVTLWRVSEQGRQGVTVTARGALPANAAPLAERVWSTSVPVAAPAGDSVFDRAVDEAVAALSRDWKTRTLVDYSQAYELNATVRLASLQDWIETRAALDRLATVSRWQANVMSARGAELTLVFSGTVDQLALNLGQQGFALSGQNGYWAIGRRGFEQTSLEDLYGQRPPVFRVRDFAQQEPDLPAYGQQPAYGRVSDPAVRIQSPRDQSTPAESRSLPGAQQGYDLPGPYDEPTEPRLRR